MSVLCAASQLTADFFSFYRKYIQLLYNGEKKVPSKQVIPLSGHLGNNLEQEALFCVLNINVFDIMN